MDNINFKFSSYTINIKLRSTKTANAIKNILPFKSIVKTWGEEIYFEIPIEESLVNIKDSKVFSQLVNYKDSYGDLAKRYNVGQQSNFINIPMLNQGIKQLNTWGVNNIQEYCKNITKEGLKTIDKNKIWYEEDDYRAWHLFGLFPKKNLKKILKKIREKNIHISLRGETIRVSPNVYNNKRELEKFFNTISKNI